MCTTTKKKKNKNKNGKSKREIDVLQIISVSEYGCDYKAKLGVVLEIKKRLSFILMLLIISVARADVNTWRRRRAMLRFHKAMIRKIDVTYYLCDELGCGFKAK